VGKTALAQALGYEAIKAGFVVFYRSIFDLVRDFMKDEAFNQQDKTLRQYLKPDLLIIDDMGLKALPKHSGEYLLEVVMRRHENRSTIMTSNRPLEEWGKLLNDVPTAGAILDRFLHHAQVIAITGKSYRIKNAPATGAENKKQTKSNEPSTAGAASWRLGSTAPARFISQAKALDRKTKNVMNPTPQGWVNLNPQIPG
jgi:hypothetical protein